LDVTTSKDECTWTRLTWVVFTRKRPFTEEFIFSYKSVFQIIQIYYTYYVHQKEICCQWDNTYLNISACRAFTKHATLRKRDARLSKYAFVLQTYMKFTCVQVIYNMICCEYNIAVFFNIIWLTCILFTIIISNNKHLFSTTITGLKLP
jgi:hypothetical protein